MEGYDFPGPLSSREKVQWVKVYTALIAAGETRQYAEISANWVYLLNHWDRLEFHIIPLGPRPERLGAGQYTRRIFQHSDVA